MVTMTDVPSIKERVYNGVLFLNEKLRFDWWNQIEVGSLILDSEYNCLLAQLGRHIETDGSTLSEYSDVVAEIFTEEDLTPFECGFIVDKGTMKETLADYEGLQAEWEKTILSLQKT